MAEMQSANAVACNGLCGHNGWTWGTWGKALSLAGGLIFFMMQMHAYLDHGGQASKSDIEALKSNISAMQTDLSLIKQALLTRFTPQSGSSNKPVNPELRQLQLRLQNTGVRPRGQSRQ